MSGGGMFLPAHMAANGGQPPKAGGLIVAQPMNDVQVMVLAAAQMPVTLPVPEAIDRAAALYAEAVALQQTTPLGDLVEGAKRRRLVAQSVKENAR
jgi:hypothetical protein